MSGSQFGNDGVLGASMVSGLVNGLVKQRQQNIENDLATQKSSDAHMAELAKNYANGLAPQQDGSVGFVPGYADPTSPTYANFSRKADLNSLGRTRLGGNKGAMNSKDYFSALGLDLPDGMSGSEVIPVGAMTSIGRNNRADQTISGDQLAALTGDKSTAGQDFDPRLANTYLKNKTAPVKPGPAMPDESDLRAYEATFGRSGQGLTKASLTAQLQGQGKLDSADARFYSAGSPGERAADTAVGKDYATELAGSQKKNDADMATIQDQITKLRNYDQGALSKAASFLPGNKAVNLVDPDLGKMKQALKSAFTSSAKENFPGRMAQAEFSQFLENNMDPSLGTANMADSAQRVLDKMKATAAERQATAQWFKAHQGHMRGFNEPEAGGDATVPAGPPMRDSLYGQPPQGPQDDKIDPAARDASAQKLKVKPGMEEAVLDPSQILKKEYSPSRNKTRITMKSGKVAVMSGDLR